MSPPVGWDRFGSLVCQTVPGKNFVDLTPLTARVMAATHPAGRHFYVTEDRTGINVSAYVCKTYKCRADYSAVDSLFSQLYGGLNYLLYIEAHGGIWLVRFANIDENTPEYEQRLADPLPPAQIISGVQYPIRNKLLPPRMGPDRARFPHQCPRCAAPAYVGFASVDCSKECR